MVKPFGALVALVLVGVSAYLIGRDPHCPSVPPIPAQEAADTAAPPNASPQQDAPQVSGVVPSQAVRLANILVGQAAAGDVSFSSYYELCVSLKGGLGGSGRCDQLLPGAAEEPSMKDES